MRKNTFFTNLKGNIGDHVKRIRTQAKTTDIQLRELQTKLNVIINGMQDKPATAENCRTLWNDITTVFHETEIKHKEYAVYEELVNAVDTIGKDIAYIGYRKSWKYKPMTIYDNYDDNEILTAFKVILLNQYNDKDVVPHPYKTHKDYVEGSLDGKGYSTMTDEELLAEAKKMRDYLKKKRESERTFKATGTDNIFFKED